VSNSYGFTCLAALVEFVKENIHTRVDLGR